MSTVAKSLSDLDAMADEILSKSVKEDEKDLKPEEISENVPDDTSKDAPAVDTPDDVVEDEVDDKKETEEGAKEEDLEKCGTPDDVKKSDESEPVSKEEDKEESEKEDEIDTEEEEEEEEVIDSKEELEKSIRSDFMEDEEIAKSMDASEFLSSVVEILSKSLADAAGEIQISRATNNENTSVLAKSLQATINLNKSIVEEMGILKKENESLKKSIADGFSEIKNSLEEVLSQPVGMRKSVKNIQVMDRDFQKSLNGDATTGIENLSKSQVMDILVSEMRSGNQAVTAGDIVSYESGAPLHAGLIALVNSKCK